MGYGLARAKQDEQTRLRSVSNWREATCFSPAKRIALALAEAVTELKDRYNSVPDHLWNEVQQHYQESPLAGLLLFIAVSNMFMRINVVTRQMTPDWERV